MHVYFESFSITCLAPPTTDKSSQLITQVLLVRLVGIFKRGESPNGMGWKGPLWVIQSNPLPKQDLLQQAAQDWIQTGLEYLQRGRIHNPPGQPVPVLRHHQSEAVLPHVQTELPMLQFVPIAPCPVAGHH